MYLVCHSGNKMPHHKRHAWKGERSKASREPCRSHVNHQIISVKLIANPSMCSEYYSPNAAFLYPISSLNMVTRLSSLLERSVFTTRLETVSSLPSATLIVDSHCFFASGCGWPSSPCFPLSSASTSRRSSVASSNTAVGTTQVFSIISALRETASSKNVLESAYSPAVRWRIPNKRKREACSSGVSRSSGAFGSLTGKSEGAKGVSVVMYGVSVRSS